MTKTANKFNSLAQIAFVEDIDQEAAASYSGGIGRINDGKNDPDVVLYENVGFGGAKIGVNAAINDGVAAVGSFNDKASSISILKGTWTFFENIYGGGRSITLGPGLYDLSPTYGGVGGVGNFFTEFKILDHSWNDTISSARRVG